MPAAVTLALLRVLAALTIILTAVLAVAASTNKRRSCTRRHRPHLVERRNTVR